MLAGKDPNEVMKKMMFPRSKKVTRRTALGMKRKERSITYTA